MDPTSFPDKPTAIDVTDATFTVEVMERSAEVVVVVDLWAPWCGPCKTLGPMLESLVAARAPRVVLAKVNVDESPQTSGKFQVQSIPAVYAVSKGTVVDGFVGALPERQLIEFLERVAPPPSEADLLVENGDEASLRAALELVPDHAEAVPALADLLIEGGESEEALKLLGRVPETERTRQLAARARLAAAGGEGESTETIEAALDGLLETVAADEDARRRFLDILETLGPEDPRTGRYRKALSTRLF